MFKFEDISLTKQEILERVSQEDIFEKYLGIYPKPNQRYTNPLRENKTPNTEFIYMGSTLFMRDWGSSEKNKDCFDIVQLLYNCNFNEALKHIENDFGLGSEPANNSIPLIQRDSNKYHVETPVKKLTSIQIKKKEFTKKELEFWNCNNNFNFTTKSLESMQIYSTEYVWWNQHKTKSKEGTFAYQLKKGIFQIYSPFNVDRKYRFRSTNLKDVIAGIQWLKKDKYVVLTKSYKDFLMLHKLNVNACALLNEGIIPTEQQMSLIAQYGTPVILFDNDEKGIATSKKICELYNCTYLQIPDGNYKDTFDFIYKEGIDTVINWLFENKLLE